MWYFNRGHMSHTYYQLLYHIVWSTKERRLSIHANLKNRLYEYMAGTFQSLKCFPVLINGMPDHVHICLEAIPGKSLSDLVKTVKVSSTKWIRQHFPANHNFEWQEGYGAFTVSPSSRNAVLQYIRNQEKHHQGRDFKAEFLWLLQNHGISYDEKYLWK